MVIIAKAIVIQFGAIHADVQSALDEWYEKTSAADWKNFSEVKQTFNSVDAVGNDRYVFNIKGNRYRLVALIIFRTRTLFIRFIGTHAEYNKLIDCSTL
jgi:mRNA interferase HigB